MAERPDAGKALYEERQKLLKGLWMPEAPPWEALSHEVKERWRSYATEPRPNASAKEAPEPGTEGKTRRL